MKSPLVLVVLLGACGRLQFDPTSAAPDGAPAADSLDATACVSVGHDEDSDGVDDACDVCPQRADNGVDTDGDGIGDDCDLAPTAQTRQLFDPFTSQLPVWELVGGGAFTGDDLVFDNVSSGAGALFAGNVGTETFELTGTLVQGNPAQAQISMSIGDLAPGSAHYYCELYDSGVDMYLSFTYTLDEVNYTSIMLAPIPGRLDAGDFRMIVDHTPPTETCYADWKGTRYSVTGTIPGGIPPDQFAIVAFQVNARFHSFVRLSTP